MRNGHARQRNQEKLASLGLTDGIVAAAQGTEEAHPVPPAAVVPVLRGGEGGRGLDHEAERVHAGQEQLVRHQMKRQRSWVRLLDLLC